MDTLTDTEADRQTIRFVSKRAGWLTIRQVGRFMNRER